MQPKETRSKNALLQNYWFLVPKWWVHNSRGILKRQLWLGSARYKRKIYHRRRSVSEKVKCQIAKKNRDYSTMVTTAMLQWSLMVFEKGYPLLSPAPKGLCTLAFLTIKLYATEWIPAVLNFGRCKSLEICWISSINRSLDIRVLNLWAFFVEAVAVLFPRCSSVC